MPLLPPRVGHLVAFAMSVARFSLMLHMLEQARAVSEKQKLCQFLVFRTSEETRWRIEVLPKFHAQKIEDR